MKIKETVTVEREIHVAPCIECGSTDIILSDSGYSSFNIGGGECKKCKHSTTGNVSCSPSIDDLANIWNNMNDINILIEAEKNKIKQAYERIKQLKENKSYSPLIDIDSDDLECLMTIEDFNNDCDSGFLSSDDGSGYWATLTKQSDISVFSSSTPEWATHVLWFNK